LRQRALYGLTANHVGEHEGLGRGGRILALGEQADVGLQHEPNLHLAQDRRTFSAVVHARCLDELRHRGSKGGQRLVLPAGVIESGCA